MKAAILHDYDETVSRPELVRFEEVQEPKITGMSDVIVRVGGAGVCRTDLHVIEGLWRQKVSVKLPYILGHENAGWVEEIGKGVDGLKKGDPVICHPLITNGASLDARRGDDMHSPNSVFPGIDANGGYAELLKTTERAVVKLPQTLAPKDVAPYADAGLTAYRVAKKAAGHLLPGQFVIVIGAGGLGHIGIQALRALCAATIIVADQSAQALELAKKLGADRTILADDNLVKTALDLTGGMGAEAVIDFVGEHGSIERGLAMTRRAGYYYIVGYGGEIRIPAIDMITSEKTIVGNLVGTYPELVELMALADKGAVHLATKEYPLSEANAALHDLHAGKVRGRAVLIP
jgi:NAD+-dependent secondary alcohol dehydrogenase Adh1